MSKETNMTFQVESDIKEAFTDVAKKARCSIAHLVRGLMRNYIDEVKSGKPVNNSEGTMGTANLTIRIEPELRDEFNEAAETECRPAVQVLRELMRNYIRQPKTVEVHIPTISPEERALREKSIRYGRASVELEGFKTPEYAKKIYQQYINGEIEEDDVLNALLNGYDDGKS